MKLVITTLLALLIVSGVSAQGKIDQTFISNGQSLLEDIKSVKAYKKFVAMYKALETGEVQEKLTAVGILGARLHKLKEEYVFFTNFLKKHYPDSPIVEAVNLKNLSDACATCQGEATSAAACKKCKGKQACSNASCVDGKVSGYDRVQGRFVAVQRDCIICKGSGQCNTCEGSGEVLGACIPCRKTGYVYSTTKALEVYEGMVQEIVDSSQLLNERALETEMLAKGMVKIDGEWYTKEQIAKMENEALEARKKADEAERRAMVAEENRKRQEEAVALLSESDALLKENPEEVINLLQNFINKYPSHEKVSVFQRELKYAGVFKDALSLEKDGAITKAIKKYSEANEVKNSEELLQKIKYLDEQTIGL